MMDIVWICVGILNALGDIIVRKDNVYPFVRWIRIVRMGSIVLRREGVWISAQLRIIVRKEKNVKMEYVQLFKPHRNLNPSNAQSQDQTKKHVQHLHGSDNQIQ